MGGGTTVTGEGPVFIHKHRRYEGVFVPRETAQNRNLSFGARGLLTFLLSLPADWEVNEKHLIGESPAGRDGVRSLVRELEAHGHLERRQIRGDGGRVVRSDWHVFDVPQTGNPSADEMPLTDLPSPVKPSADKTQPGPGLSPQTALPSPEKPSAASEAPPLTASPSPENPSIYKTNSSTNKPLIQDPPIPPVPLRSTGGAPPVDETAGDPDQPAAENGRGLEVTQEQPSLPVNAPAARSKKKARVSAALTPLPPDTPELEAEEAQTLADWWARRCENYPRADRLRLGPLSLNAIRRATDQGVLLPYLLKAVEAGWQSLGHAGAREVIERLARDQTASNLALVAGGCSDSGMLGSVKPFSGHSDQRQRKLDAMNRLFTPMDGGPADDHVG